MRLLSLEYGRLQRLVIAQRNIMNLDMTVHIAQIQGSKLVRGGCLQDFRIDKTWENLSLALRTLIVTCVHTWGCILETEPSHMYLAQHHTQCGMEENLHRSKIG